MRKIKTFAGMYIIGILIIGVLAVVTFFVGVKPLAHFNKIMTKGTETVAIVTGFKDSGTTINEIHTYNVVVEYVDADGNAKTGTSIDFLSLDDSQEMQNRLDADEVVRYTIRYIGDDIVVGKSLLSTAGVSKLAFSLAFAITALICVTFIVMMIKTSLQASAMNKALTDGEICAGVFLETGKAMTMGNTKYFSVTYEYTNAEEDVILVKSPKTYTHAEAETLRNAKNFDVKTIGKTSVIAHDFNNK